MSRSILLLVSLILSSFSGASYSHDSSIATLQVIRLQPDKWVFELRTPLYGLDQAMRKFNSEKNADLEDLVAGSKRYKELIVEYVKSAFHVTTSTDSANTNPQGDKSSKPRLGPGRIKLDDHVSTLIFDIVNMPSGSENIEFNLPYMSYNESQHNVLRLIDFDRSQRYILSSDNDFSVVDGEFFSGE